MAASTEAGEAPSSLTTSESTKAGSGGAWSRQVVEASHWTQSCKYFPLGKCIKGKECMYRHDLTRATNASGLSGDLGHLARATAPQWRIQNNPKPHPANCHCLSCKHD